MTIFEETLEKFKKIAAVVAGEEGRVTRELEKALQRREDLHTLPYDRENFIKEACEWTDVGAGQEWPNHLKHVFQGIHNKPLSRGDKTWFSPLSAFNSSETHKGAITYIFGDLIKDGITRAINEWDDWPAITGPPKQERLKELKVLDKKILQLQNQLQRIKTLSGSRSPAPLSESEKRLLKRRGKLPS